MADRAALRAYLSGDDHVLEHYRGATAPGLQRAARGAAAVEVDDELLLSDEQLDDIEARLDLNPRAVLPVALPGGETITEEQARGAIELLRKANRDPGGVLRGLARAQGAQRAQRRVLPPDYHFEGYDPSVIPVDLDSTSFEYGDIRYGTSWLKGMVTFRHSPYPEPSAERPFVYDGPSDYGSGVRVAVFADFANGLYAPRYIARTLVDRQYPYAFYLGDVYYGGTEYQYLEYYYKLLAPMLDTTRLFALLENHELDSGGKYYFHYLDVLRQRHAIQQQEGSTFCVRFARHQVIGLDVNYLDDQRYRRPHQKQWLAAQLDEARAAGRTVILLTGGPPYPRESSELTALAEDILPLLVNGRRIDLWCWGHEHYGALYLSTVRTPFVGLCAGHGGFPYRRREPPRGHDPQPAWFEYGARFPERYRQDMGNNGYCELVLHADGSIGLQFIDWMRRVRHTALMRRGADGMCHVQDVTT